MKKKKQVKAGYTTLLVLCTGLFLLAGTVLFVRARKEAHIRDEFAALAADVSRTTAPVPTPAAQVQRLIEASPAPASGTIDVQIPVCEPLGKYAALYADNPDLGGWIRIEGTVIDYPVMFTPEEPEKYIDRSFDSKPQTCGVPFIGAGCTISPRSDNIVVYGHHMKSGTMFAAIVGYRKKDFWQQHPCVYFSTLYEEADYEVFAAMETDIWEASELRCFDFINAADEKDFKQYMTAIEGKALYKTGVKVSYGDALLTLSTCAYHTMEGRFVVVARKVIE